jgi:pimeloyl-ACP methyl ester carboxylesterase
MSDFRHSDIQLGGFAVHVAELGDPAAQPILFLHGWPQSWAQWQQVMELAGEEFRAVAIDLPGVGQSAGTATDGSKQALAGVVHGLIERLTLDRPVIVGHDVGGMIAYSYLRRYQDAGPAVIVDVVIPGLDPWEEVIANPYLWHFAFHTIPALPELLVRGHQGPYFGYFFDVLAADPARITPQARAAYAQAYASDAALAAGFGFYRAFAQDAADNRAAAGEITGTPVLYVRGAASRGNIDSYAQGLRAAGIRQVATALVPDAGHFVAEEQPLPLWRLMREFITSSPAASRRSSHRRYP